ncbi:MAG: electron transport complex subunit RsxE, partial [Clostridiaceae bacterium]|nr:electron transport complex subunit RsxE [Clostridiaceae bacterium]
ESLGIFIPLITVNCIILARAEMFASKNSALPSIIDGLGMGIGFTAALFLMGTIREFFGNGSFLDIPLPLLSAGGYFQPALIFILPPGGFFVFGMLIALSQKLAKKFAKSNALCAEGVNESSACELCGGCSLGSGSGGGSTVNNESDEQTEPKSAQPQAAENDEGGAHE